MRLRILTRRQNFFQNTLELQCRRGRQTEQSQRISQDVPLPTRCQCEQPINWQTFSNATERAKVRLSVRSNSWRTWSSKQIAPRWTGPWTVEVQDELGNVLQTVSFIIEEGGD